MLPEESMSRLEAATPPEMQRVPLEKVYLQVCASGIEDRPAFLAKTPDPPDQVSVQLAESALKDMGALDATAPNGLTPLGHHLAALPCHPRLGKILILGCLLGVPGPCLSICAAMSARSPLLTTQDQTKRAAWQCARIELAEWLGVRSDHCMWAHIMHEWRFGDTGQWDLCRHLGLSFERMCSAIFERKHLCASLEQIGMLPGNFLDDEWYSHDTVPDWTLVRSAVVGGLYPNIIRVERSTPKHSSANASDKLKSLRYSVLQKHGGKTGGGKSSHQKSLNLHPTSLCFGQDQYHYPWLAFYTIQQTTRLYAYDVSEVPPYALLLFGAEPTVDDHTGNIEVGGWVHFSCQEGAKLIPLVKAARKALFDVMLRKLVNTNYDLASSLELQAIVQLLKTNGLGYRVPAAAFPSAKDRIAAKEEEFGKQEETDAAYAAWLAAKGGAAHWAEFGHAVDPMLWSPPAG